MTSQLRLPIGAGLKEGPGDDADAKAGIYVRQGNNGDGLTSQPGTDFEAVKREENLEALLAQAKSTKFIIVALGSRNPAATAAMQRAANQISHVIGSGKLLDELQAEYGATKVLVAADYVHALQLLKEHGYHSVVTVFADPGDRAGDSDRKSVV